MATAVCFYKTTKDIEKIRASWNEWKTTCCVFHKSRSKFPVGLKQSNFQVILKIQSPILSLFDRFSGDIRTWHLWGFACNIQLLGICELNLYVICKWNFLMAFWRWGYRVAKSYENLAIDAWTFYAWLGLPNLIKSFHAMALFETNIFMHLLCTAPLYFTMD